MQPESKAHLEAVIKRLEEENRRLEKHRAIWVGIAVAFILVTIAFGSWYFDLKGNIPIIEASAYVDGWYEGYNEAYNKTYGNYWKSAEHVRSGSYEEGYSDCFDELSHAIQNGEYSDWWWHICEEECCGHFDACEWELKNCQDLLKHCQELYDALREHLP